MLLARRSFLTGLASTLAAPAIVRVESLMPIRAPKLVALPGFLPTDSDLYAQLAAHARKTLLPRLFIQIYPPRLATKDFDWS